MKLNNVEECLALAEYYAEEGKRMKKSERFWLNILLIYTGFFGVCVALYFMGVV